MGIDTSSIPRTPIKEPGYLKTCHEWKKLPPLLSVPNTAQWIADFSGQNREALRDLLKEAIAKGELQALKRGALADSEPEPAEMQWDLPPTFKPQVTLHEKGFIFGFPLSRLRDDLLLVRPSEALRALGVQSACVPEALKTFMAEVGGNEINEQRIDTAEPELGEAQDDEESVNVTPTAPPPAAKAKTPPPPWINNQQFLTAFGEMGFADKDKWERNFADPPEWMKVCRKAGERGKGGAPTLWNPAMLAWELYTRNSKIEGWVRPPLAFLDKAFERHEFLQPWADLWELAKSKK